MDENDLKILEILNEDSRTPYDLIGKRVNLTGNAVRTRVVRMIDDGVIDNFVFKIRPEIFGISTCYVSFVYPQKLNAAEIINKKLDHDPHYDEVLTGIDGTTIIHVMGEGENGLAKAIDNLKSKLSDIEFDYVIRRYMPPYEEAKLNNSLLKVISCLIRDVRMSVAELARECNMTSKSVKYYLEQISEQKIGRFSANYQPYKVSRRYFVNIFISKPDTDYIHFANMFDALKKDLKGLIFNDYLLVDPPGIFCDVTTESLEEIDQIEQKIMSFLKDNYIFVKMFPSRAVYRNNLVNKLIREKIKKLETVIE